ncbi:MAG: hypothetical protein NZT61_00240 [Deltaproteobacteria bacterium]|nr:hypothetical protein [Deltaproteobacteria bacterium]MCX7952866.1 hypothetical protein [Deltaproteobacteria bacterium]
MARYFVAFDFSDDDKQKLYATAEDFIIQNKKILSDKHFKIKRVQPKNIHLTVKFLGNIDGDSLAGFLRNYQAVIQSMPDELMFEVKSVSLFKKRTEAIYWFDGDYSQIVGWAKKINAEFIPHITFLRIAPCVDLEYKVNMPIQIKPTKIALYNSVLGQKGPRYEEIIVMKKW